MLLYQPRRYRQELEDAIWAIRLEIRTQSLCAGVFSESQSRYIIDELTLELAQLENALAKSPDGERRADWRDGVIACTAGGGGGGDAAGPIRRSRQ
jgi:hypothetical protein